MRYLQQTKETRKIKLDLKDEKILSLLSQNVRTPLSKISKKVALSRDSIKYRIKNYEKNGLIQGYRTIIDISKLGYTNYHLFLKLDNPSKDIEEKILKKLSNHEFIRAIIKFSGNYDLEIAFLAKNIEDLDNKITKITGDLSDLIQNYEILTISKIYVNEAFPLGFLKNRIEKEIKFQNNKFDKKDIEILKLIGENAKIPLYEISDKINLSTDAVSYRIKNLISSGIIIKFIPVINYVSLNYNLHTILLNVVSLDENKEKKLKEFLLHDKNILWASKAIGKFNTIVYLLVKDIQDLQESLIKLRGLFPKQIKDYETLIAYEEYKYTYFPKELF